MFLELYCFVRTVSGGRFLLNKSLLGLPLVQPLLQVLRRATDVRVARLDAVEGLRKRHVVLGCVLVLQPLLLVSKVEVRE